MAGDPTMEEVCNTVCECGHRRGIHALHGVRCYAVLNVVTEAQCGCTEFVEHPDQSQRIIDLETVLGDLIDALHDELRLAVADNSHVLEHVEAACKTLGQGYDDSYVTPNGSWL